MTDQQPISTDMADTMQFADDTQGDTQRTEGGAEQASGNAKPRQRRQARSSAMAGVWQGRILSLEIFRRNVVYIIIAIAMMVMYIANKFECQAKLQEVMKLKTDLENAKTDCVNASARYNSMIRESHMKAYVDTMHIDLTNPDKPPYHLSKQ